MTNSIKTFGDIQNAEMKELVAFYNAHNADATVKRFLIARPPSVAASPS